MLAPEAVALSLLYFGAVTLARLGGAEALPQDRDPAGTPLQVVRGRLGCILADPDPECDRALSFA